MSKGGTWPRATAVDVAVAAAAATAAATAAAWMLGGCTLQRCAA